MASKCLCGWCNINSNSSNDPSTSSGKKDPKICPVVSFCDDQKCECPFCQLPDFTKCPWYSHYLMMDVNQLMEYGNSVFLKAKMIDQTNQMQAQFLEIKKIKEEAEAIVEAVREKPKKKIKKNGNKKNK